MGWWVWDAIADYGTTAWEAGRFYAAAARDVASEHILGEETHHALDYARETGSIPNVSDEDLAQSFAQYLSGTGLQDVGDAIDAGKHVIAAALPYPWWVYAGGAVLVLSLGAGVALRVARA